MKKIVSILIAVGALSYAAFSFWQANNIRPQICFDENVCFNAELARTDQERQKGLQGHAPLRKNEAMVFVFPHPGRWAFWMKDMTFPIDILWVNAQKKVVHVQENALPCQKTPCQEYYPYEPANFVVEIASGEAAKRGISIGSTLKVPMQFSTE